MIRMLTKGLLGVLTVLIALFFVGAVMISAPASAQENVSQNQTQPTEQYDTLGDLIVHSVEFNGNGKDTTALVTVTWRGETPEQVTFTQLPRGDSNDVLMSRQRVLPNEKTELSVDLVSSKEPLVMYTDQSIKQQRALRLDDSDDFLISGPWDSTDAQITGAAGLLSGLFVTFAFAWRRSSPAAQDPEKKL
ncbi:hypothetical protein [Halovenus sp. HT40]|uniref:hypothetical protein n=1 Tax=Halovenus sp. HT40 TaxID=3126691 RepID=UPI00300F5B5C